MKSTGALGRLVVRLREAPKRVQAEAARGIAAEVTRLIDEGFDGRSDPYGKPWEPPKDGGTPMERTGRLRRGFRVRVVPGGVGLSVEVTNEAEYARWLQRGTERMEARKMFPDGKLPKEWRDAFEKVYRDAIAKWYARMDR